MGKGNASFGGGASSTTTVGKGTKKETPIDPKGNKKDVIGVSGQVYGAGAKSSGSLSNEEPTKP